MKFIPFYIIVSFTLIFSACSKSSQSGTTNSTTGVSGSLARFTIVNNTLYIVDQSSLNIYDISKNNEPKFIKTTRIGQNIETIYPMKNYLAIGSGVAVFLYDITDPLNPTYASDLPALARRCDPVVVKGSIAYSTQNSFGACGWGTSYLSVYNIANIYRPSFIDTIPLTQPNGLAFSNNALYVCEETKGLILFDISSAYNVRRLKLFADASKYYDAIAYGNSLVCFTDKGLTIYDIANDFAPKFIKHIQ